MKNVIKILVVSVAVSLFSGCASIISGQNQNINLSTSNGKPVDAVVISKEGSQEVSLPAVINVKKSQENIIVQVKENNTTKASTTVIPASLDLVFCLNYFTGFLGSTTDYVTGAMWEYEPTSVIIVNEK